MRLLIVEDEAPIANLLADFLRNKGYIVDIATNYEEAFNLKELKDYNLIVSDYLLPGKNGYELIKDIRRKDKSTPILMLSAIHEISNKIRLINGGVDDYLAKPFSQKELNARIRALLRRRKEKSGERLTFADLELDLERGEVRRAKKSIYLTSKESGLLKCLMQNRGKVCKRRLLIDNVWDEASHHLSNTIESHILKLRKKIDFKKPKLIHTIKGRGYKLDLED